jgi:phosphomevalonate kinase
VRDEARPTPHSGLEPESLTVQDYIDKWSAVPGVLAWKMPGAGGGGYLACVVSDSEQFAEENKEAIRLTIRRPGM